MSTDVTQPADPASVLSGVAAVDAYLADGFTTVPGMSSRFAAAITAGLMRIQSELGVTGSDRRDRHVRGPLLHRDGEGAATRRDGARHGHLRLAEP